MHQYQSPQYKMVDCGKFFVTPCGIIRLTLNSALVQNQFITNDDKDLRRHMAWRDQYLNDLLNVLTMRWRWGWPWGTRCGPGHTTVRAKEIAICKALTHNRARRIKEKIGVYITVANLKIELKRMIRCKHQTTNRLAGPHPSTNPRS